MASLLRSIVAGPRLRHPEAGLDLCYVTDNIIATSGPSSTYPQRAYRNPTDALVKFLDYKHGQNWAIWEFRAEGTGYPDSEVYNRIHHYPWPDHHPPPFALIPNIMASIRDWLKDPEHEDRVLVVHCKAGKGRSGTVACSYLISQEGWTVEEALARFTERRMRNGFGNGISIPSQLRWIRYVDWWTKHGKVYVERQIEIMEVHVWGLRDGVKVAIEGYMDEGKTIKTFHTFAGSERTVVDKMQSNLAATNDLRDVDHESADMQEKGATDPPTAVTPESVATESCLRAVMFRPSHPIILPTSDINIDFERRNKATYGFTMVTSVAHVWFNTFFESQNTSTSSSNFGEQLPARTERPAMTDSGVFEIEWDAMDGIKGSARKGTRALDRLAVVWRAVPDTKVSTRIITEPSIGEPVPESKPADWENANRDGGHTLGKDLGLRTESPSSTSVSKASSRADLNATAVTASFDATEEEPSETPIPSVSELASLDHQNLNPQTVSPAVDLGMEKVKSPSSSPGMVKDVGFGKIAGIVDGMKAAKMRDLPTSTEHLPGQMLRENPGPRDS
ncbi:Telomerase protein component 1 [Puttea exsequens]|nr:Telomerase protein component 1 [Puttea exsequens]